MLLDNKHKPWMVMTLFLAAAASVVYLVDAGRHPTGPNGSTLVGLVFGVVGYLIMWFCAGLGMKRRVPHWRLGKAQTWLRGHIWLGLLLVVLVAYHTGFQPVGPVGVALWTVLGLVTVSGIVGLFLQQTLPRILYHGLHPLPSMNPESPAQVIKELIADCAEQAEKTVITYAGSLDKPAPDMPIGVAVAAPAAAPAAAAAPKPPAAPAAPAAAPAAGTPVPPPAPKPATPPPAGAPAAATAAPAPAATPAAPAAAAASAAAPAPAAGGAATAMATPPKPPAAPAAAAPAAPKPPATPKIGPPMGGEPVRRFYLDMGHDFWAGKRTTPLENESSAESVFAMLKTTTPQHIHPGIDDLSELASRRRQLLIQRKWMRLLHGWLLVHVPLSWGFIVFVAWHAVQAIRYWGAKG